MPLRLRLLIAVIVLVFAGLAVADIVTYTSLKSFLFKREDQQLLAAEPPVIHELSEGGPFSFPGGPGGQSGIPTGSYGQVRDSSGAILVSKPLNTYGTTTPPPPSLPDRLPGPNTLAVSPVTFTTRALRGSLRYRVIADDVPIANGPVRTVGTLIIAVPLTDIEQTLGHLRLIEGIVSASVLLGLGFISWWLVRGGLRPLEEIGVTAGAIAAGDLTQRVKDEDPRTEIGRLGVALNAMLAQIEAAFDERRASEARLRRFVADASHELRTPLTSIRGYAELFRRGADSRPEDLAKSMRRIEAEAARMGVLVDDLLLLARLDQGRPLEQEPVDLGRIAADAVESARAIDPDRQITVEVDGSVSVLGDEGRLRQVLDNLLDNARVHTPPGTPVEIRLETGHEDVVLSVRDHGPGFSPGVAGRVFERFYRGGPARSRITGGAGLGLSIVAAIVEAHGGKVSASSPTGSGAVFEVRLPARPERGGPAPDFHEVEPSEPGGPEETKVAGPPRLG